jgi:hypothetical protein
MRRTFFTIGCGNALPSIFAFARFRKEAHGGYKKGATLSYTGDADGAFGTHQMNTTIRRILTANSLSTDLLRGTAEIQYPPGGQRRGTIFPECRRIQAGSSRTRGTARVDLRTVDDLTITMRQNYGDAMTLGDTFWMIVTSAT